MKPTVLVATTECWYPAARLVMALSKAGCNVEVVCPSGHPVTRTSAASRIHRYNGLRPLHSFARAIDVAHPDLVIPADDLATQHLHELYWYECRRRAGGSMICSLIERSLGSSDGFDAVYGRSAFSRIAREEHIRAPKTEVVENVTDLLGSIARIGFPLVLKVDGSSGGHGVRVVKTVEEAETAFRKLHRAPSFARAVKHALIDRDLTLLKPSVVRRRPTVNTQEFVAGHEATSTIACFDGRILASLHFEVLQKVNATGHATVVRTIEIPDMAAACVTIARRLKLSGLYGLDFMLEPGTRKAHLIEINPRSTQVGHLTLGPEHDLPAALYSAITGGDVEPASPVTANDTIALFPQEWKRDHASSFLLTAYHDVPWEEPRLVSDVVNQVRKLRVRNRTQAVRQQQTASSSPVSNRAGRSQTAGLIVDQE